MPVGKTPMAMDVSMRPRGLANDARAKVVNGSRHKAAPENAYMQILPKTKSAAWHAE
jgi:hypothetical protein